MPDHTQTEPVSSETNLSASPSTALRIQLLGGFRVWVGDRPVTDKEWRLRKVRSLLKLLALAPSRRLHREQILEILWPGLPTAAAANNLHYTLHVARTVLDPTARRASRYLVLKGDEVTLSPGQPAWIDIREFEKAAFSAQRSRQTADYEAALRLYTGDLLPQDRYEEWTHRRRETLRELHLTLLLQLARSRVERAETQKAIEALHSVILNEPLHEEAHRELMSLYARAGQRDRALRQYQRLAEGLRRDLGTDPDAATQLLYQQISSDHPAAPKAGSPAPRRPQEEGPAEPHNLPIPLTSFVGREQEVEQVSSLLRNSRLVTIVGAGGAGKTRLALQTAYSTLDRFSRGVRLVELASVTDPQLVEPLVARALGVREDHHHPLRDALVEHLQDAHVLLVLDNCEHLLDSCAHLTSALLSACSQVHVLATSREPLGLPGETCISLGPLSMPAASPASNGQTLLSYDSVRLFLERARLRQPDFAVTERNAPDLAEICRRLDGMPLAIELASARVGVLSVGQIASRLDDSLGLLAGAGRTVAPRHQTMRDLLDWSYNLLDEQERSLFSSVSVFASGWTLETLESVLPAQKLLDPLSRLVDKSLVIAEHRTDSVRYRMLEPVRQYARERLEQAEQADYMCNRHAAVFAKLAERAEPELTAGEQVAWLERLDQEQDNFRAALLWALDAANAVGDERSDTGTRLVAALWPYWRARGQVIEGRHWLHLALGQGDAMPRPRRAALLLGAGLLAWQQSDFESAVAMLRDSLALQRDLGDQAGAAEGLNYLGAVAHHQGEYDQAAAFYEESLVLRRQLGDRARVAASLNNLGLARLSQGRSSEAETLLLESLDLARQVDDNWSAAYALDSLGMVALDQGEIEQARDYLEASLRIVGDLDDRWCIVACLDGLAAVAARQGQTARAARL
ncbi:MAG: tetratricopeptide repeat protein, partial [Chloroflexota bacterium]|nr:tetratricopeptide repeat protein [Chloroflexota bacterium]